MGSSELTTLSSQAQALQGLPDRDLTTDELEALVTSIAADPDSWAHHVAFDGEERVYASLHRDSHVDVWLLCWVPENDTRAAIFLVRAPETEAFDCMKPKLP